MSKKRRKDKEIARLRREVEVLRAQVAGQKPQRSSPQKTEHLGGTARMHKLSAGRRKTRVKQTPLRQVDPKYIKKDLVKSGILTIIACAIVAGLYIFRGRITFL